MRLLRSRVSTASLGLARQVPGWGRWRWGGSDTSTARSVGGWREPNGFSRFPRPVWLPSRSLPEPKEGFSKTHTESLQTAARRSYAHSSPWPQCLRSGERCLERERKGDTDRCGAAAVWGGQEWTQQKSLGLAELAQPQDKCFGQGLQGWDFQELSFHHYEPSSWGTFPLPHPGLIHESQPLDTSASQSCTRKSCITILPERERPSPSPSLLSFLLTLMAPSC